MNKIESASPSTTRKIIHVQTLLGLPDSTPNPHLWYMPSTMPAVGQALVKALSAIQPAHAAGRVWRFARRNRAAPEPARVNS
jgi:zinc/manganese transport system substrate-binding protein